MDYQRVVEIYAPYNHRGGSGYLIRKDLILTAFHVIDGYETESLALCDIRFIGDFEAGKTEWRSAGGSLCWHHPEYDLALLKVKGGRPSFLTKNEIDILFGILGDETLHAEGCGFPRVQKIENRQNPEPLKGELSRLAGLKENQLRLQITSPIPDSSEEWAGISGTALFVGQCLVGVIIETNKSFKEKTLWATPISLIADNEEFCQLVLDDPNSQYINLLDVEQINLPQNIPDPSHNIPRSGVNKFVGRSDAMALGNYLNMLIKEVEYIDSPLLDTIVNSASIPLKDIFVSLQAISTNPQTSADNLIQEDLEHLLRRIRYDYKGPLDISERSILDRIKSSWRDVQFNGPYVEVQDAINAHQAIVILGHPGTGKSTLLKYLAFIHAKHCLKATTTSEIIPILVSLSTFPVENLVWRDFQAILSENIISWHGSNAASIFEKLADLGRILLLFDGLDEVDNITARTRLVLTIQKFAPSFLAKGNRVIITSRLVGYQTHRPLGYPFTHFAIAELKPDASRKLIKSLIREIREAKGIPCDDKLLQNEIHRLENMSGAQALLKRPLTATALCILSLSGQSESRNVSQLFHQVANLFEEKWNLLTGRQSQFTGTQISTALSTLANWLFRHRHSGLMTFQEATIQIADNLVETSQIPRADATTLSQDLLAQIRAMNGLVVEKSPGLIGFNYRVFQEFYAASSLAQKDSGVWEQIHQWLYDANFEEVIRFTIGLSSLYFPGKGEQLISSLFELDKRVGSPLHRGFLIALSCLSEIQNISDTLLIQAANKLSEILFEYSIFKPHESEDNDEYDIIIYRPTIFSAFRRELASAIDKLRAFSGCSKLINRVILSYRRYADSPSAIAPQKGSSAIILMVDTDDDPSEIKLQIEAANSKVRALNLIEFLGNIGHFSENSLKILDQFFLDGDSSLKNAVVNTFGKIAQLHQDSRILDRLHQIVFDDSIIFERFYEESEMNYKGSAITWLCKLNYQDQEFIERLEYFLEHGSRFDAFAVAKGIPHMAKGESIKGSIQRLCDLVIKAKNVFVKRDFVIEILVSGLANQSLFLQECLIRILHTSTWDDLVSRTLTAILSLDWLAKSTRQTLIQIVFDDTKEAWLRMNSASCLRNHVTPAITESAQNTLQDSNPTVRFAGVCFVAGSGVLHEEFIEPLIDLAQNDKDDNVRAFAYQVLVDHGYSNETLNSKLLTDALEASWDSGLRYNAMHMILREGISPLQLKSLNDIVDDLTSRYPSLKLPNDNGGYGIEPEGSERKAYNATLFLALSQREPSQLVKSILSASLRNGNSARGRVYQDFGLPAKSSPFFLDILLSASAMETEYLVGIPSLLSTLDRLGPLPLEGLEVVLSHTKSSINVDHLGICCELIGQTIQFAEFEITDELVNQCFRAVAQVMCSSMFDYSYMEDVGGPKMRDRIYDALLAIASRSKGKVDSISSEIQYPWKCTSTRTE